MNLGLRIRRNYHERVIHEPTFLSRWPASGTILGSVCATVPTSTSNPAKSHRSVWIPSCSNTPYFIELTRQTLEITATMSSFLLWFITYLKPRDTNCSTRKGLSSLSYICSFTVVQTLGQAHFSFLPLRVTARVSAPTRRLTRRSGDSDIPSASACG